MTVKNSTNNLFVDDRFRIPKSQLRVNTRSILDTRKSSVASIITSDSESSTRAKSVHFDTDELHDVCLYDSDEPSTAVTASPRFWLWDSALAQTPRGTTPVGVLPRINRVQSKCYSDEQFQLAGALHKSGAPAAKVQSYITDVPFKTYFVKGNFPLVDCSGSEIDIYNSKRHIAFESLKMRDSGSTLDGIVAVANLAYEKIVKVIWSSNDWSSVHSTQCTFDSQRSDTVDIFRFSLDLDEIFRPRQTAIDANSEDTAYGEPNCVSVAVSMAFCFSYKDSNGDTHDEWENNAEQNFNVKMARQYSRPLPSSVFDFFDWRSLIRNSENVSHDSNMRLYSIPSPPRDTSPELVSSLSNCGAESLKQSPKVSNSMKTASPTSRRSIDSASSSSSFGDFVLQKHSPPPSPKTSPMMLAKSFDPLQYGSVSGFTWEGFLNGYRNVPDSSKSSQSTSGSNICVI